MIQNSTVLIVEDDIHLAEVTCEVLEVAGLQAVFRTSIAEAMDYLARNSGTTSALFTDINLASPMSGIELAVYVAEEYPAIAICVTSGFTGVRPKRLPEKATFLAKPWHLADLMDFADAVIKPRS